MSDTPTTAAAARFDYAGPTRNCDIVMKGGITSGIVYPLAVCELAQSYRFKNIGGTSAGAIAAAITAAAEYGRAHGGAGFAGIEALTRWLGRDGNLAGLFQPQRSTRALFDTLFAFRGHRPDRHWYVVAALLRNFPLAALLGALPGLLLVVTAWRADGSLRVAALVAALLATVCGAAAAVAAAFVLRALRAIPANCYGLCSGLGESRSAHPPLTTWLTDTLNALAGKRDPREPLTFGDLWGGHDAEGEKVIHLEMMTLNLTHGRPYRLPFAEKIYYFDPDEFRKLFPAEVVDWMVAHARKYPAPELFAPLVPLPDGPDLPVVVAARLSLSFPLLISAVPLYAVDYSRTRVDDQPRRPERCWFSDGGIASNFPVHFFDAPIPRWPTFAINLRGFHPDYPPEADQRSNVWMPKSNNDGVSEWWTRFDAPALASDPPVSDWRKLRGFMAAVFDAMLNWRDNVQIKVPGYRDRVVHISLDKRKEGGLNLDMPPDVIATLSERGRCAGELLRRRYACPPERGVDVSWDNHRWVRYRSTMGLLEWLLGRMEAGYRYREPGDRSYEELIARAPDEPPESYRWKRPQTPTAALDGTQSTFALLDRWREAKMPFGAGAPRPTPELRITPRI